MLVPASSLKIGDKVYYFNDDDLFTVIASGHWILATLDHPRALTARFPGDQRMVNLHV